MYCQNCGNKINDEKFCPNCGVEINNNNLDNDEELLKAYIGPKYLEFTKGNFSVCTFLFGIFYVLYRKMWIFGLLWIGANFILNTIFDGYIYNIITLGLTIYLAFVFKKQYLEHANKKVEEIKLNYHGNDREALINLCRKKGGTTIIPIVVILVPLIVLMLIAILFFKSDIIKENIGNYPSNSDLPRLTIKNVV